MTGGIIAAPKATVAELAAAKGGVLRQMRVSLGCLDLRVPEDVLHLVQGPS